MLGLPPPGLDYRVKQLATTFVAAATPMLKANPMPRENVKTVKFQSVISFAAMPLTWEECVGYLDDESIDAPLLPYNFDTGEKVADRMPYQITIVFPKLEVLPMCGRDEAFRSIVFPPKFYSIRPGAEGSPRIHA
jgi:hypothetical protein